MEFWSSGTVASLGISAAVAALAPVAVRWPWLRIPERYRHDATAADEFRRGVVVGVWIAIAIQVVLTLVLRGAMASAA